MKVKIKKINDYSIIETFSKQCRTKGVNFDKSNTYYGLYKEDKLISIASYYISKNGIVKFKSNYTIESERNKGYMTLLIKEIIRLNNFENMIVYCLKSSVNIYLSLGFELVKIENHKYFDTYIVRKKK